MRHGRRGNVTRLRPARWTSPAAGVNVTRLTEELQREIGRFPKQEGSGAEPGFSRELNRVFDRAEEDARRMGDAYVSTEHLLLALVEEKGTSARTLLSGQGVSADDLRQALQEVRGSHRVTDQSPEDRITIPSAAQFKIRGSFQPERFQGAKIESINCKMYQLKKGQIVPIIVGTGGTRVFAEENDRAEPDDQGHGQRPGAPAADGRGAHQGRDPQEHRGEDGRGAEQDQERSEALAVGLREDQQPGGPEAEGLRSDQGLEEAQELAEQDRGA